MAALLKYFLLLLLHNHGMALTSLKIYLATTVKHGSSYHLLAESNNFHRLRSLDLSDNDIFTLEAVVSNFVELKSLTSLSLEGNPCSVVILYKDIILSYVPDILFLDNVEVLKEDRNITDNFEDGGKRAQVMFRCHRIMGLPKPPKDKKAKQFVHLEVELPLLEEVHFPEPDVSDQLTGKESDKKNKRKGDEKSVKSTKSGKGKKSPYARPSEYDPTAEKNNFSFKTERVLWNKIIYFAPVLIESPEGNVVSIRDTFKSVVNVRVVYLKVLPPKAQKKGSKKDKKSKKDSKSSKKKGKPDKGKQTEPKEPVIPEIPQEVIQKKVTLCSFDCVLKPVNWSDETVDFYWADHKLFTTKALQLDGCLKAVNYGEGKKGSKKEKSNKSATGTATTDGKSSNVKNAVPKIFTCQVGFGLSRSLVPCL